MTKEWFDSIKWDEVCLECIAENEGVCPRPGCAEDNYDKNGNKIPEFLWYMDGNGVEEYLRNLK